MYKFVFTVCAKFLALTVNIGPSMLAVSKLA